MSFLDFFNDNHDYEEFSEGQSDEEIIEDMRGTIEKGTCVYCHARFGMKYDGSICFICSKCGKSIHEDSYYLWLAGRDLEFD